MRNVQLAQVYFIITRTCNLFCSHCIRSSGPNIKDTVQLEQALHTIQEIAKVHHNPSFLLSGGEPTLHPNFFEILDAAYTHFEKVVVNTNGLNVKALTKIASHYPKTHIQISLDGDEAIHNLIRGKGTFNKTLHHIKLLGQQNITTTIATTVGKSNVNSFANLDVALTDIPFTRWTIKREVLYGRASKQNALTTSQWNDFVEDVANFANYERIEINPMFELSAFIPKEIEPNFNEFRCNCSTGRSKIYINPDLTVFPCACLEELQIADFKVDTIEQVLTKVGQLKIEAKSSSPCIQCPAFNRCRGGCPGASYHAFGEFGIGDPRCPAIEELVGDTYVK